MFPALPGGFFTTQFSSVAQSCPTLYDPMDCSTPGLPVHHQLPESTYTHVHWVGDADSSHPLSSPSPAFNLSQHQGLFQWVSASHQVAKVLELQLQHIPYAYHCYANAKSLQSSPTLCDPIDGSPPVPPSLGFSRQEHWSGLPFPSPVHESEKWKWSHSVVSNSSRPHGLQPTRLLCPWIFQARVLEWGAIAFSDAYH